MPWTHLNCLPPIYPADVSPTQSRWTGREPPVPVRNASGTADTTGPGERASYPGLDDDALAIDKKQAGTRLPERETPNYFPGMCIAHTSLLLARQWIPPRSILPKSAARTTSCYALLAAPLLLFAVDIFPFYG